MKKLCCILLFFCTPAGKLSALPSCYLVHYPTEDATLQHNVMEIMQDRKGFLWFTTWNGFARFDGYEFTPYKLSSSETYSVKSNRIDRIYEDRYGYLWLQSYDGKVHRFDPSTETFQGVQSIPDAGDFSFTSSKIKMMPSGKVWVLSVENGGICIHDSTFTATVYNQKNGQLKGKIIFDVFEDNRQNTWLLTDNGLVSLTTDKKTEYLSYEQQFFCALQWKNTKGNEIWFGSESGRIRIYNPQTKLFRSFETNASSGVTKLMQLSDHEVLIITSSSGFFIYDTSSNRLQAYNVSSPPAHPDNNIHSAHIDKYRNLWLETNEAGVLKFNLNTRTFKYFRPDLENVNANISPLRFQVWEDVNGRVWVYPKGGGLSFYNPQQDNLELFYIGELLPDWKSSNMYHALLSDRQGNMWICTRTRGLGKVVFNTNNFSIRQFNPNLHSTVANNVRVVFEDKDGYRWIATLDEKIRIYDPQGRLLGYLLENGTVGYGTTPPGIVYCITQDRQGNMWIGTRGNGVFLAKRNSNATALSFDIFHYKKEANDIYSLSGNAVYSIFQDSKDRIWIGTYGNGLNLAVNQGENKLQFFNHRNNFKNYPLEHCHQIRSIVEDTIHQNICIGTTFGMLVFKTGFSSPEAIKFKYYAHIPKDMHSLSGNDVYCIKTTRSGEVYVATYGGGLHQITAFDNENFPLQFKVFTKQDGMPSDATQSLIEDNNGMLWVITGNDLIRFNPHLKTFESFGDIKRLMRINIFQEGSYFYSQSGEILLGYSNGLLSFFPDKIKNSTFNPYITLESLNILHKKTNSKRSSPYTINIDDTKQLVLTHNQNYFSIEYAALDFIAPENIHYAHKMEGIDDDWLYVDKQRVANYTNLPKGKYVFCVKSTNSDGIWMDNERRLSIEIKPSFWETGWAYALYLALCILFVTICIRISLIIYKLKRQRKMDLQLSEMKLRFFTDISHEIRTPLTMIIAPLEHLMQNITITDDVRSQLSLIQNSSNRILRLVNQILDFRKFQHHKLSVETIEIAPFVETICQDYYKIAEDQQIHFRFINEAEKEKIITDKDCLEKIVFNLLSNAFKYTPAGKSITVKTGKTDKGVFVEVKDEGCGIPKEKQKILFTRFASFNEDKNKPSTGIGLSMVKELTGKLDASISVESEPGKGSMFTVSLPKRISCPAEDMPETTETVDSQTPPPEQVVHIQTTPEEIAEDTPEDISQPSQSSILIVEDDDELRQFLKTILAQDYIVYEASDGQEGLEKAGQVIPDFIVSDIMMARMDGIDLLKQIKTNINTSHIPVILLTAKSNIESQLEGLEYGADDYITKPFSVPYFRARIHNLLKQRKRLQELYCSNIPLETLKFEPRKPMITSQDEVLMEKIIREIEENMENSAFSVEDLVSSAGMSRTVFFKKVKAITGLAPIQFIRDMKIKRAAQFLDTGQFSVKEVGFMIGISDPTYFRKCFKQKYGVNPTQYRAQRGIKESE
ncbi:MAG: response regulator [Candidatus Symbiothrix sp.]|jgi:signal transduction histidine kinase/DNA-binding response OmpR family regulator/ligand-binding sensor domain-containing protein|nr:response regulator [Candidatus Symbiothrix sp.]